MPTWNSTLYLKYASERTRPATDLAGRIAIDAPARVVDLGCGPGTSTIVLGARWPNASITGVDNSPAMLAAAQRDYPQLTWVASDIAGWQADAPYDVVFSNAAMQWVPDHAGEFPRLFDQVAPGGALAVQMPFNFDTAPHLLMREMAASDRWRSFYSAATREDYLRDVEFYYDVLAPRASRMDIWTTEYQQVIDSAEGVVEWYKGSGLRPWLDALPDDQTRERFVEEYRAHVVPHFPTRADGRVLFPFRRLFIIAYR